MQLTNLPAKIARIWANAATAGYVRQIPAASQQQITQGAASFDDGFPPVCFLSTASGGVPPAGVDFNGILQQITAWNRWQAAGGTVPFDQAFASAIGGYPYGAIVQSTTSAKLWFSTTDSNMTNPDGPSAAGWVAFSGSAPVLFQAQPIYPQITSPGNVLTFTVTSGQVIVNGGLTWQHRGGITYSTDQFTAGQRTFPTQANKIYLLSWNAPVSTVGAEGGVLASANPIGLFSLDDLTGAGTPHTDPSYDSKLDRMLCALIVTDASNNLTLTALVNRQSLSTSFYENPQGATSSLAAGNATQPGYTSVPRIIFDTRTPQNGGDGCGRAQSLFTYNWARTPKIAPATGYVGYTGISGTPSVPYIYQEGGSSVTLKTVTRYATLMNYQSDYNQAGIVDSNGSFILTGCFARAYLDIIA